MNILLMHMCGFIRFIKKVIGFPQNNLLMQLSFIQT